SADLLLHDAKRFRRQVVAAAGGDREEWNRRPFVVDVEAAERASIAEGAVVAVGNVAQARDEHGLDLKIRVEPEAFCGRAPPGDRGTADQPVLPARLEVRDQMEVVVEIRLLRPDGYAGRGGVVPVHAADE